MQLHARWMAVAVIATGLALTGCADPSESDSTKAEPAKVVEIDGSEVKQVILTEKAAERLGIEMEAITEEAGTKVVPYASVVYDANGDTWAYTSPKPLTFQRTSITVASITGEKALLSAGPERGTEVVTVGTAELFGTENEIGH